MTFIRPVLLAGLGVLTLTGEALAHAHLTSATPAIDGRVATAPRELSLVFSEGLDLRFTGVTLTGPDKAPVATGPAALGAGGGQVLVVPLTATVGAGTYRVDWHALAKDGHRTSGSYTFSLTP